MDLTLEGYAWLPRMIDKARAARAGTIGRFLYPCPIDRACLSRLGLDPDAFADLAAALAGDDAILAALHRLGIPDAGTAWFDAVALEAELHRQPAQTPVNVSVASSA
jgi:hypothetical protein